MNKTFENAYGYFTDDGCAYIVSTPFTPHLCRKYFYSNLLPICSDGKTHTVQIIMGT
jgi:hypothetical protein